MAGKKWPRSIKSDQADWLEPVWFSSQVKHILWSLSLGFVYGLDIFAGRIFHWSYSEARRAHFTPRAMMQHKPAPGADAERAQGVCSRCCNTLKRVPNTGLASCLLWQQRAAPSQLRFTFGRVLGRPAAVDGVSSLWRLWSHLLSGSVITWPLSKIHLRRRMWRYNEGRFPRASDLRCSAAFLRFHLGCEITLQHRVGGVDAAHESGKRRVCRLVHLGTPLDPDVDRSL